MPRSIFQNLSFSGFCLLALLGSAIAAEESSAKEAAKKEPSTPVAPAAADKAKKQEPPPATTKAADSTGETAKPAVTPDKTTAPGAAATLPQVEVKKSKITELDHELHEQERNIAREAKNAKPTEADNALNSAAINPTLFGGASAKVRSEVAQERLELMEFEKDLTEQIAHAKTKEEKAALKKQLDDLRAIRRNLEAPAREKER